MPFPEYDLGFKVLIFVSFLALVLWLAFLPAENSDS